jgi:RNA polymerase sigma-70 factor (ECF subfamily)
VNRVKAGDRVASAELFTLFGPRMMAVARRFMRSDDDCDDAVQDAFISAFRSLAHFEAKSRLCTWLHRITVNCCLMRIRISSSRKETSIEELLPSFDRPGHYKHRPAANDGPSIEVGNDETRDVVRRAIDGLPENYRSVLRLRYIEEMNTAATAALLATSENNVKHRLRRARQALRILLKPVMIGEMDSRLGSDRICVSRRTRSKTAHHAELTRKYRPIPSSNTRLVVRSHLNSAPD